MRVTLRDGSRIAIRPVEPYDREAIAAGFERLSPESRYRRFFAPVARLRARDLDYLTRLDHHDHEALIAVDEATRDGVGVARYVRTGPDVAEPAITVVDDWQGRGVASVLLDALVARARAEGVRRFEAPVLAENVEAARVLERLGPTRRRPAGQEVVLLIDLTDEAAAPGRPGLRRLLAPFAAGAVEPARALVERLWPRRLGRVDEARRDVVVVGTDGSPEAAAAVVAAAELAEAFGATVEVVGAHGFLSGDEPAVRRAAEDAAAALLARGLHVHTHVLRGDPALVLTDLAAHLRARALVVGAGAPRRAPRRVLGGTATLVAERAPCDVLIARLRAAR